MIDSSEQQLLQKRRELRQAVHDLRYRKLNEACRWASMQLLGTKKPRCGTDEEPAVEPSSTSHMSIELRDAYDFAMSCFESKEYNAAIYTLERFKDTGPAEVAWLYYYSRYLRVQKFKANKNKTQHNEILAGSETSQLCSELQSRTESLDAFQLYVLGLTLMDQSNLEDARKVLVESVTRYPCNWSAWKALAASCPDHAAYREIETILPQHFMADFFRAHVLVDLQLCEEGLDVLSSSSHAIESDFPDSVAMLSSQALAHSHMRNYDISHDKFQRLLGIHPHIIEGMDAYSNILYVKEDHVSLASLARRLVDEDAYRPETCCVIGNYYSFRAQHDKAIVYFQRALKLNPNCLAAWTLMGHEFVELKNPPAAIEAYRKAVEINPSDYRAWYGLGQTYELVNMPYYALHYYGKAVILRPEDARMWNAMGHCYSSPAVGKLESAIRCYKRALPYDKELVSLRQLAHHHSLLAQSQGSSSGRTPNSNTHYEHAAKYYQMILEHSEAEGEHSREDAANALSFLAEYHKNTGDLRVSQDYYSRLLDFGLPQHREVAKLSLKEIHDIIQSPMMQSPAAGDHTPGSGRPR
jgi:anaphase-promoting complex subunit 8